LDGKIAEIRAMYAAGVPVSVIQQSLNISRPTLYKYVNTGPGHSRYDKRPDHTVWDQAFDVITDQAAYWVGLLITDGSIVGGGRRVKLSLKIQDTPTLERFKAFVRTSAPVGKPHVGSRTVRFTSPRMCKRLAELGVVPQKTHTARVAECLLASRHFWRGAIDGDGSVFPNERTSPGLRLCGSTSSHLLAQWVAVCDEKCPDAKHLVRPRPDSLGVSDVILYGHSAITMAHWLYAGISADSPAMDRKLEAYHQMCAAHGGRDIVGPGKHIRKPKS